MREGKSLPLNRSFEEDWRIRVELEDEMLERGIRANQVAKRVRFLKKTLRQKKVEKRKVIRKMLGEEHRVKHFSGEYPPPLYPRAVALLYAEIKRR